MSNQKGVSLLELMMAIGGMGIVALSITSMYSNSVKNNRLNRSYFEEAEFLNDIYNELSYEEACQANFLQPDGSPKAIENNNISVLYDRTGAPLVQVNQAFGQSETLMVTNISTTKFNDTSLTVNFTLERNANVSGPKNFQRSLRFYVETDDPAHTSVVGCFDVEDSVQDTIEEIACLSNEDRGIYYVEKDGDGNIVRCRRIGWNIENCTADGEFVSEVIGPTSPINENSFYGNGCDPIALGPTAPFADCSLMSNLALISFTDTGIPTCTQPTAAQLANAFVVSPVAADDTHTELGFELTAAGDRFQLNSRVPAAPSTTTTTAGAPTSTTTTTLGCGGNWSSDNSYWGTPTVGTLDPVQWLIPYGQSGSLPIINLPAGENLLVRGLVVAPPAPGGGVFAFIDDTRSIDCNFVGPDKYQCNGGSAITSLQIACPTAGNPSQMCGKIILHRCAL